MKSTVRRGFGAIELLVVLAILGIIAGILMAAVQGARGAARKMEASNNLHQLGIAVHLHINDHNAMPAGLDTKNKNQSAFVALLPYIDQANLKFDATSVPVVKVFLDPRDSVARINEKIAGSNFLFCAGSEPGLEKNNGAFFVDSATTIQNIANGSSNTLMIGTTLRGDGGQKAVNVKRQHVALKKEALKGIKEDAGVQDFKDDKNIVGNRCANWTDGRFLQGTFTATRGIDDEAPDVDAGGTGGLSALRSLDGKVPVLYCDAHVSIITNKVSLKTLKMMANCNNKEAFTAP